MTTKPHKHAEIIKAWADGALIQVNHISDGWRDIEIPHWDLDAQYRIKPEPPKYPQTRMTDNELLNAFEQCGAANIDRARFIANAAIARAIQDGDVVTLDEHNAAFAKALYEGNGGTLSKVASAFAEAMALESARRTSGPGGYPLSDAEIRSIAKTARMRIRKELAQIIVAALKENGSQEAADDMVPADMLGKVAQAVQDAAYANAHLSINARHACGLIRGMALGAIIDSVKAGAA